MVRVGDMGSYSYQLAEPGQAVVCQHEEDSPNLRVSTTEVYFSLTQNWICQCVCPTAGFQVPSLVPSVAATFQHGTSWLP